MRCRDLLATRVFMESHVAMWPVDALLAVFTKGDHVAGQGYFQPRPYVAYRHILGQHMLEASKHSTLGRDPGAGGEEFPRCEQDMSKYTRALGATANEFFPGQSEMDNENSQFAFLHNATDWQMGSTFPDMSHKKRTVDCLRPVVVNLAVDQEHAAFEEARRLFKSTNAVFVDAARDEPTVSNLIADADRDQVHPGRLWRSLRPRVESVAIGTFTFLKRSQVTMRPHVDYYEGNPTLALTVTVKLSLVVIVRPLGRRRDSRASFCGKFSSIKLNSRFAHPPIRKREWLARDDDYLFERPKMPGL